MSRFRNLKAMETAIRYYWWGNLEWALEELMEVAEEEINRHVQETFDPRYQPCSTWEKGYTDDGGGKSGMESVGFLQKPAKKGY